MPETEPYKDNSFNLKDLLPPFVFILGTAIATYTLYNSSSFIRRFNPFNNQDAKQSTRDDNLEQ